MKEMAAVENILEIKKILATDERIKSFEFFDQEKSFAEFKRQMPDLLNENFEDDQYFKLMPTSFQLTLKNFEDATSIKNSLQSKSGVEEIYLSEDFFEKYFKLRTGVEVLSIVIAIIMIVFLGLIIQNSIQQMIWIQSEEIAIKEMFGASKKFIQKPIYIEVGLINLVSSLISICISLISYYIFFRLIKKYFGFLELQKEIVFFNSIEIILVVLMPLAVSLIAASFAIKKTGLGWADGNT